jgi:hypothetical protein
MGPLAPQLCILCAPLTAPSLAADRIEPRLPNGRLITRRAAGLPSRPPFALAVRPDGQQIVLPCIGWPFSLNNR